MTSHLRAYLLRLAPNAALPLGLYGAGVLVWAAITWDFGGALSGLAWLALAAAAHTIPRAPKDAP